MLQVDRTVNITYPDILMAALLLIAAISYIHSSLKKFAFVESKLKSEYQKY